MTTEIKITSMDPAITVLALRGTASHAHALPGPQRILMQLMSTWEEVGADFATLARPEHSQMRLGLMTVQTARPEHFRLKVGRRTATIALGHLRGPRVALTKNPCVTRSRYLWT